MKWASFHTCSVCWANVFPPKSQNPQPLSPSRTTNALKLESDILKKVCSVRGRSTLTGREIAVQTQTMLRITIRRTHAVMEGEVLEHTGCHEPAQRHFGGAPGTKSLTPITSYTFFSPHLNPHPSSLSYCCAQELCT